VPKSYPNILLFAVQNKIENTTVVYPRRAGCFRIPPDEVGAPGKAKSRVVAVCTFAMPRPSVHQFAPLRERVRSRVGLFGFIADDMSRACSASSRG
jgi:hypothetical protein